MPLWVLPTELLRLIVEHLSDAIWCSKKAKKAVKSLTRTSRQFHSVFNPVFYTLYAKSYPDVLLWALKRQEFTTAQYAVAAGVDPNAALQKAVQLDDLPFIKLMIESGVVVIPPETTPYTTTAIHVAAAWGHPHIVKYFLELGIDPDVEQPDRKRSPLHCAAMKNRVRVINLLLDYGADINRRDGKGMTALDIATVRQRYGWAKRRKAAIALVKRGATGKWFRRHWRDPW